MEKDEINMKEIFNMNREQQKQMFKNIINDVEIKRKISTEKAEDDIFFLLDKMKIYFFTYMDNEEKSIWINECCKYILEFNEFAYQLTETMSIIYKFVSSELQEQIFNSFYCICDELLSVNRGITTVSIFLKNTHQVYNEEQEKKSKEIRKHLKNVCVGNLKDTYEYIENNYNRKFTCNKEAKVLLLLPEFQTATSFLQPPLGLLNAYGELKKKNITTDILDNRVYGYSFEQVLNLIGNYEYIVMTSTPLDQVQTYFLDYRHTLFCNMANYIKENAKNIKKLIICGSHGTVRPDIIEKTINCDIILRGEFDFQLPDLIQKLIKNEDISKVPNIIINKNGEYIENIIDEEIAHPKKWEESIIDYSILPVSDYYGYQYIKNTHLKKKNWSVMQATRGCPYNCIFCFNFYTKNVRYKKIDNLIKEMKQLQEKCVEEMFFIDQTFTVNKEYTCELCQRMIDEKIKIRWSCETRIDLMDEKLIRLMKQAGCYAIWFGVESFDERVLEINKKGYKSIDFKETIELLNKYDLDYRAFIMIGMKGETKESLKNTVDRIIESKIKLSKTIVQCQERYGTKLFDDLPEEEKEKLNRFEILGLRKGRLSNKVNQEDINNAVKRLMLLANND